MKGSVFCATTLDGFIATKEGDISFLNDLGPSPTEEEEGGAGGTTAATTEDKDDPYSFTGFMATVDVIIMGRKTFEKVVSFGPDMWAYGSTHVIVWTRQADYSIPSHLQETVGTTSQLEPAALFEDLQTAGYTHAYIDGGTTISAFAACNLIDDWIITRVPILLGNGIPLFAFDEGGTTTIIRLTHVHTKVIPETGMITSHYRRRDI